MAIKVDFTGISFYPVGYNNENLFDGRLVKENDYSQNVSVSWQNEQFNIQNIIYTQYYFKVYQKETFFAGFEKIKIAGIILVTYNGVIYNCKLTNYEDNNLVDSLGFKEVTVHVADLLSRQVSTTYSYLPNKAFFKIYNALNGLLFSHTLHFNPVKSNEFIQNEVDNFKDKITDYTKRTDKYTIRMILTSSEMESLYTYISEVSINPAKNYIKLTGTGISVLNGRQYEIVNQSEIGIDLFQIDLKIITLNTVTTQWN